MKHNDGIEIQQTALFDGYLFRIRVNGYTVSIISSEHYIDDINAITLSSIMYNLFTEYPGVEAIETESV